MAHVVRRSQNFKHLTKAALLSVSYLALSAVFNKGYWASADGNNNISPGQPRNFRVTGIARF